MFNLKTCKKMKKTFIFAAMAAIAITACNKEEIAAPEEGQNLVYREYTATIEDGVSTKVAFGTPGESTIPAYFQNGDEIAITDGTNVYKGTVSVPENGDNTIIKTEVPEEFELTEAYYPYEAYKDGKLTVPATQTYGSVPVLLQSSDIEGENITFSAADAGSAVICYTLTGDIAIKEAYLYYKDNASFWVKDNVLMESDYTLTFSEPLKLSESAQKIYFVVSAETAEAIKSVTLEVVADAPDGAYGNADYSYYLRKASKVTTEEKPVTDENGDPVIGDDEEHETETIIHDENALKIKSGDVVELPAFAFNAANPAEDRLIWEFGSAHGGNCNWTISNNGSIDGTTNADYASVTMGVQKNTDGNGTTVYRADLQYLHDYSINIGAYRFMAVKFNTPQVIAGNADLLPENAGQSGNTSIKFDITGLGQWRNGQNKSLTFETATPNCEIWCYDMLVHFGADNNYAPTATPFVYTQKYKEDGTTVDGATSFKIADLGLTGNNGVAPEYDVYWIGFFNSVEEIEAYIAETENTPAE